MSARSVHGPLALFVGAMRSVLRELPRDGTGLRVDPTPAGHVTVTLLGPDGPLATCVVAQRAVPRGDGRQLTIDDVLARGTKPAAPPPAPAVDTPPAPPARSPATVADDRGADLGEDGLALTPLWVAASEWSSLDKALRTELGAHVHDAWHREGDWYTATPYADASGFVYDLLCRAGVAVRLDPPPAPPAPTKTMKPAKGKLFRGQWHALDRSHAHPNTAYLAGPGREDMERPKGLDDAAWRALVAQTVAVAPAATWRLYSAKGKCLWDSRDGGQP